MINGESITLFQNTFVHLNMSSITLNIGIKKHYNIPSEMQRKCLYFAFLLFLEEMLHKKMSILLSIKTR